MQTILFHSTIFGPIHSRRLGSSLGVNLSPADGKICTFDCLYCEAGFNAQGPGTAGLPAKEEVARLLREKLAAMKEAGEMLDVITFSGNGEPTLHPDFPAILDDTLRLRSEFFPQAKVSVLCNSTRLDRPEVAEALRRADNNIVKLDSAITATIRLLDRPNSPAFTGSPHLPSRSSTYQISFPPKPPGKTSVTKYSRPPSGVKAGCPTDTVSPHTPARVTSIHPPAFASSLSSLSAAFRVAL